MGFSRQEYWSGVPLPSNSASLTMPKPLTVWITANCGKFLEMGIPDHLTCLLRNLYAGQEAIVRTEHGTGSKLGKGYVKAVYCHPAYLIFFCVCVFILFHFILFFF